jgi:hypothetical protein
MREQRHDEQQHCDPVRPARPIFVDVYAHEDKNGEVKFCHDWRLQDNGPIKGNGPIEVPQGTPPSPIHFHLYDNTGRKLKFLPEAREAIWASVGQCPKAEGGGGQIEFPEAKSGGNTLKVNNSNSADCELHYALRFKDKNGNVECYDPIFRNKGGVN